MNDGLLIDGVIDFLFGAVLVVALLLLLRTLFFPRDRAGRLHFVLGPIEAQEVNDMTLRLTNEQLVRLSISPKTAHGHEAAVDGAPTWTSSNPDVATVAPETGDAKKAVVLGVGIGSAQIVVSADADLGDGVRAISGVLDIEVVAAEAVSLGIVAGTPEELPAVEDTAVRSTVPGRTEPDSASAAVVD